MSPLAFTHVYEPPAAGARTLLLLHGTGGDEHDLLPLGRAIAPGAGLLSPRGQVLERGMPRFFRRLAEGVFDEQDLGRRAGDLADFVAAAAQHYKFDQRRVVAAGFSNGANIAGAVLLLRPGTFSAAALLRAMVPVIPDPLPSLAGTPVLLSNGRSDPLIGPAETERLAALLRAAGAEVTLQWQPAGHELAAQEIPAVRAWLSGLPD